MRFVHAATTGRRATMPDYAYERVVAAEAMPGVFVLDNRLPAVLAIQELLLIVRCTEQQEWLGRVAYLPL